MKYGHPLLRNFWRPNNWKRKNSYMGYFAPFYPILARRGLWIGSALITKSHYFVTRNNLTKFHEPSIKRFMTFICTNWEFYSLTGKLQQSKSFTRKGHKERWKGFDRAIKRQNRPKTVRVMAWTDRRTDRHFLENFLQQGSRLTSSRIGEHLSQEKENLTSIPNFITRQKKKRKHIFQILLTVI